MRSEPNVTGRVWDSYPARATSTLWLPGGRSLRASDVPIGLPSIRIAAPSGIVATCSVVGDAGTTTTGAGVCSPVATLDTTEVPTITTTTSTAASTGMQG